MDEHDKDLEKIKVIAVCTLGIVIGLTIGIRMNKRAIHGLHVSGVHILDQADASRMVLITLKNGLTEYWNFPAT